MTSQNIPGPARPKCSKTLPDTGPNGSSAYVFALVTSPPDFFT